MATDAVEIRIDDWDGTRLSLLTAEASDGVLELDITHTLNSFSTHRFAFWGLDERRDLFERQDLLIDIKRRIDGKWYDEYEGFHITPQDQVRADDNYVFTSYGRGYVDLIGRRDIYYPAISAQSIKNNAADIVMTEFVRENATAQGAAPTRLSPVTSTLTTALAPGTAPKWAGQRSWKPLLDVLQEIAAASGCDFSVRRIPNTNVFEFYTGYPQLGEDVSDRVKFALDLGNMVEPSYTLSATEESNIVAVLGQGQGNSRHRLLRKSGAEFNSPWNERESIVEATGEDKYLSLVQAGDDALAERKAKESFTFTILQNQPYLYGRDYKLGYVVTGQFGKIVRQKKIVGVRYGLQKSGAEDVVVDFGDYPPTQR